MDLSYSPAHEAFRREVQDFLDAHQSEAVPPQGFSGWTSRDLAWQRLLVAHGYVGRTIPVEYGGKGTSPDPLRDQIIADEFDARGVSKGLPGQGITYLVPTLLEAGSPEQCREWILPTLLGEIIWCQGYSEPGSGSDLASLQTSAVCNGDNLVVNGQKIWTSTANHAQMMFCLVRTERDRPRHHGLSYLIIPMSLPGIEVRPLQTMTGTAWFNEVFFTDVRVPRSNVVGGLGNGWKVANSTLRHERGNLGDPGRNKLRFDELIQALRTETRDGRRLIEDPVLQDAAMALQAKVLAMKCHHLRLTTAAAQDKDPGVAGLVTKLASCELNYGLDALAIDALGELGALYGDTPHLRLGGRWQYQYMHDLGLIIGGGTAQIQKNIISERGLDLPREARGPVSASR